MFAFLIQLFFGTRETIPLMVDIIHLGRDPEARPTYWTMFVVMIAALVVGLVSVFINYSGKPLHHP